MKVLIFLVVILCVALTVALTVVLYACLIAGAQADRDMEKMYKELEEKE